MTVIDTVWDTSSVKKVVQLFIGKSVNHINLYGWQNCYSNVARSKGSAISFFKKIIGSEENILLITDYRLIRIKALKKANWGNTFIFKIRPF